MKWHPEKIQSAIERYQKETIRVISVLDGVLAKSPSGYLVGGKATIADLSFITWNRVAIHTTVKDLVDFEKEYPAFWACVLLLCDSHCGLSVADAASP